MNLDIDGLIRSSLQQAEDFWVQVMKSVTIEHPHETMRQRIIRATIMMFEEQYKPEMRKHERAMKKKRETLINAEASSVDNQYRSTFLVPDSLVSRINVLFDKMSGPESARFLSDEADKQFDESRWFAGEFPRYRVCDIY